MLCLEPEHSEDRRILLQIRTFQRRNRGQAAYQSTVYRRHTPLRSKHHQRLDQQRPAAAVLANRTRRLWEEHHRVHRLRGNRSKLSQHPTRLLFLLSSARQWRFEAPHSHPLSVSRRMRQRLRQQALADDREFLRVAHGGVTNTDTQVAGRALDIRSLVLHRSYSHRC